MLLALGVAPLPHTQPHAPPLAASVPPSPHRLPNPFSQNWPAIASSQQQQQKREGGSTKGGGPAPSTASPSASLPAAAGAAAGTEPGSKPLPASVPQPPEDLARDQEGSPSYVAPSSATSTTSASAAAPQQPSVPPEPLATAPLVAASPLEPAPYQQQQQQQQQQVAGRAAQGNSSDTERHGQNSPLTAQHAFRSGATAAQRQLASLISCCMEAGWPAEPLHQAISSALRLPTPTLPGTAPPQLSWVQQHSLPPSFTSPAPALALLPAAAAPPAHASAPPALHSPQTPALAGVCVCVCVGVYACVRARVCV